MPARKLKINSIDIDSLEKTPVIIIGKSAGYSLELISDNIIEQVTITDPGGKVIHHSVINGNKFVFTCQANCKDMFLLNIKMQKQKDESRILIL
jgi:hypothetical protein